jgi:hypothetical protein
MQKPLHRFWIGYGLTTLCFLIFPINNFPTRLAAILLSLGAYVGIVYFLRRWKPTFIGAILIPISLGIFLIAPDKEFETQNLRTAYLASLKTYTGSRYIWGGENKLGIDCSGLVRAGFVKANVEQGLLNLNPKPVRFGLSLWWHDCSAKALGEEYRGFTRRITSSSSINALDDSRILPGDIAITANGVHVLAFLGNNEWIEADPDLKKVVIVRTPSKDNPWFDEPVQIMRWTALESN